MKIFFTIFFAILSAAAVILCGLWAKGRVDSWEYAWRRTEAEASAIIASHKTLLSSHENAPVAKSVEASLARIEQLKADRKSMEADWERINEIEKRAVAILEHKPFGLPLSAHESEELAMLKQDIQKLSETKKP